MQKRFIIIFFSLRNVFPISIPNVKTPFLLPIMTISCEPTFDFFSSLPLADRMATPPVTHGECFCCYR